ncbi:MAG: hypothetical protein WDO24_06710 [Pseudomonadota bacterium]
MRAAGTASFNAGANAITLTNATNAITGSVGFATTGTHNASFTNNTTTDLGGSTVGGTGTLTIVSAGAITNNGGSVVVGGASSFQTTAGAISVTNASNALSGAITLLPGSGTASLVNTSATNLVGETFSGSLTVTSGGNLTETGALSVAGAASFTTSSGTLTLTNSANGFSGGVALMTAGAASLTNSTTTSLAASNVGGNLVLISTAGPITESGAVSVGGTATFNAGANAITLTTAGNSLVGAVALVTTGANDASLINSTATVLGATTVGGNLAVTSNGAVTQTGVPGVTIGSTATFNAGANAITLTNTTNSFGGSVASTGTAVSLTQKTGLTLTLGTTSATSLIATANQILIPGAGSVSVVGGNVTFQPTTAGTTVQLGGTAGNSGLWISDAVLSGLAAGYAGLTVGSSTAGAVSLLNSPISLAANTNLTLLSNSTIDTTGNTITLSGTGALTETSTGGAVTLGTTTLAGALSVTAAGAIGQGAATPISASGTASFNTGGNTIMLTVASNNFGGAVSLNNSGSNNVALQTNGALVLAASNVGSGTLTVTAAGMITQTGAITQQAAAGSATFIATGGNDITLTNPGNVFTGGLVLDSTNALVSAPTVTLNAETLLGNLTIVTDNLQGAGSVVLNGILTIEPLTNTTNVQFLGGAVPGLDVSDAQFGRFSGYTGGVVIGSTTATSTLTTGNSGTLAMNVPLTLQAGGVGGQVNMAAGNLITLQGTGSLTISAGGAVALGPVTLGTGSVTVTAGGAVTQTGALTSTGNVSITAAGNSCR